MNTRLFKIISITARVLSVGASATLWYLTYKYIYKQINDDYENEFKSGDDYNDCYKVIRMKIPSYSKGAIIGKSGSTIKRIQEKTKTTIKFVNKTNKTATHADEKEPNYEWTVDLTKAHDATESFDMLLIRGLTLRVMEAEKEIKAIIESVPIFCEEHMFIDNRFVGKIIGKKGENIRRLKEVYKVQIDVDKTNNPQRQITIRGINVNNLECKLDMIKMVDAEILKENRFNLPSSSCDGDRRTRQATPKKNADEADVAITSNNRIKPNSELPQSFGVINEKMYIYVSSIVDCSTFYAHIVNDNLVLFDKLIDEMTAYFTKKTPNQSAFNVGDIVAAYYEPTETWQRVKIIGVKDKLFEVMYLDYGDSSKVKLEHLRAFENNSRFLDMPFLALQMVTHGIQPCAESWIDSDINEFGSLTKVGLSHKLAAILKNNNSPYPEVQLIDEETGIDIAENLIANGRAKRV